MLSNLISCALVTSLIQLHGTFRTKIYKDCLVVNFAKPHQTTFENRWYDRPTERIFPLYANKKEKKRKPENLNDAILMFVSMVGRMIEALDERWIWFRVVWVDVRGGRPTKCICIVGEACDVDVGGERGRGEEGACARMVCAFPLWRRRRKLWHYSTK